MKISLSNLEVKKYLELYSHPNCFYNNIDAKISDTMWLHMESNKKKFEEHLSLVSKAEGRIVESFLKADKADKIPMDGDQYRIQIKEEYLQEYQKRMMALLVEKCELDIDKIDREDISAMGVGLSAPEREFIKVICGEE